MTNETLQAQVLAMVEEAKALRGTGNEEAAQKKQGEAAALAIYGDPKSSPPGGHGDRIFGVLCRLARNGADADDAFGDFYLDVIKGIHTLRLDSNLGAWLYTVALNALRRRKKRDPRQHETADEAKLRDVARKSTTTWRKEQEQRKEQLSDLLDELEEEDRAIVLLYSEGSLSWIAVAGIVSDPEGLLDEKALKKEAARLKKRYERAKEKLHELAKKRGLC